MKRSRESFDAEADQKAAPVVGEPSVAVGPVAAGSGSGTAASGEAPPVDAGVGDVAPEQDRKKTVSGDGGDGPSDAALPSELEAAYNEIEESYEEAAEYAMWGHVSAAPTAAPTATPTAAPTAAPTEVHLGFLVVVHARIYYSF